MRMSRKGIMVMKMREMTVVLIISAVAVLAGCSQHGSAQKAETIQFPALLRMLAEQPDHMADRTIGINGSIVKIKFAKKQNKIRQEFHPFDQAASLKDESYRGYSIVTITKPDQPTLAFDPQEKTYAEASADFKLSSFDIQGFLKNLSGDSEKIRVEKAGTEMIEGHESSKIRIKFEDATEEVCFYFANDLNNLFLKMDSPNIKQMKGTYAVSNISLDVPDDLFEIPKGSKKVDFNAMMAALKQKLQDNRPSK